MEVTFTVPVIKGDPWGVQCFDVNLSDIVNVLTVCRYVDYYTGCCLMDMSFTPNSACQESLRETRYIVFCLDNARKHDLNTDCVYGACSVNRSIDFEAGGCQIETSDLILPIDYIVNKDIAICTRIVLMVYSPQVENVTLGLMKFSVQFCFAALFDDDDGPSTYMNFPGNTTLEEVVVATLLYYKVKHEYDVSGKICAFSLMKKALSFCEDYWFPKSVIAGIRADRDSSGSRCILLNHPTDSIPGSLWISSSLRGW